MAQKMGKMEGGTNMLGAVELLVQTQGQEEVEAQRRTG